MAATVTKIDYLAKAAEAADKLYPKIVSLRCTHASGAKTYAQLRAPRRSPALPPPPSPISWPVSWPAAM